MTDKCNESETHLSETYLQVAADGYLGDSGPVLCARWGGMQSNLKNMAFDYKDVYKIFILYV